MTSRHTLRTLLANAALLLGTAGIIGSAILVPATPAQAIPVFDASNYGQNLLTAARTLQQVNQQIRSLQNEATMLVNMAKNLSKISFPELDALRQTMQEIDQLMGTARGIGFQIDHLDEQFRAQFPRDFDAILKTNQRVAGARQRLDTAMDAFQQTMRVQSKVVGAVEEDAQAMASIVAKSQGAEGALAAQQATNQLLALTAKQQFQIQTMMAAQYRAETIEQARRVQAEAEARAATKQFLGSGKAYTPG